MKSFNFMIFFLSSFIFFVDGSACRAGVTLPWSTTYDCAEWAAYDEPLQCDSLERYLNSTKCGYQEQITADANNPLGTGKGQRHWVDDGYNSNTGGTQISLNTPQKELWIRWYVRYEAGFTWGEFNGDKMLYIYMPDKKWVYLGWYGWDKFHFVINGVAHNSQWGTGWTTTMGGKQSDGQWHAYEIHMKLDTNGADGILEAWIDGEKIYSETTVSFGGGEGWSRMQIASNQKYPANGTCMKVDFDDVTIRNDRYIGLLDGGQAVSTVPPLPSTEPALLVAPENFQIN